MKALIRRNCEDIWNAFMVKGATFSKSDIPICPTTAKEVPNEVVSYRTAKSIYRKETRREILLEREEKSRTKRQTSLHWLNPMRGWTTIKPVLPTSGRSTR